MGYIFMVLALAAGLTKGFCGKKISGIVSTLKGVFYMNTMRMLICILVGFFIVVTDGLSAFAADYETLLITFVSGVSTALFVVSWILCIRKGAYVTVDVFLMLGGALTVGMCKIFFDESILTNQLIGYILLVIASYFMCSYSSRIKGKFSLSSFFLLVACGAFSGLSDFAQKWFTHTLPNGNAAVFNFYTYIFASIVLLICFAISNKVEKEPNDAKTIKVFMVVGIMAICLFAYSYFKTKAAVDVPAALLYPITSGANIVLSALMAAVFFKEKLKLKCITGMAIAIGAIVIMSF